MRTKKTNKTDLGKDLAKNQLDIEIGSRLTQIVEYLGMSSRAFAIDNGFDTSAFSKLEKGERGITLEKLVDISAKHSISIDWIMTGHGSMFKEKAATESAAADQEAIESYKTALEQLKTSFSQFLSIAEDGPKLHRTKGKSQDPDHYDDTFGRIKAKRKKKEGIDAKKGS